MQEENREGISGALKTLAAVVIVFLLLAALYVGYQAMQVLFPPNTYETALLATVEDTVDAEGVLLFEESYVAGGGTLGYLVADGERVSAGTAVAEIYSDAAQATLRQQLTQINDQIDLLQRSQNTTSVQLESLRKNRSAALYDLMDSLDAGDYEDTDAEKENYILAQNKLWVITGEVASFSDQITALTQQAATVQSQLGNPSQITAPQTGYFIRSSSSGRLNAGSADILALDAANLKAYVESSPEIAGNGRLCGIKAFLAQVLQQSLLPADGILLDQTQDGLLPLLLALVIPSAGASHVIFSLRCVCVIVCRAVSGQWPGTGRLC